MRKIILLLSIFYSTFLFSQNFVKTWQQCYGGSEDDWVYNIIPYKSGFLFFGHTRSVDGDISYNPGTGTAWLVNIDDKGNIVFDKCYEGYAWAYGKKILPIDTGGFYFLGDGGNSNNEINGYWLAQIDTNFNLIWQDVLGGSYVENFRGGCIAHDGGLIESGITGSPDGDIEEHFGSFDNWLVKMNADGSRDWVKTHGNAGAEESGEIIPTRDGGYIYTCSGYNQLPGNTYCEGHDGMMAEAWLIKLDAQGNKEWHRCYGGSYIDYFKYAIELDDGYIIVGNTESSDGDINNFHGMPGEHYDAWVVRTDMNGDIIWSNCYGGSNRDSGGKITKNSDNTFTIIGSTKSHDGDIQGNTAPNNEDVTWMIKIDGDGNLLYQKPFDEEPYLRGGDYVKISDYKYVISSTKNDFGCNYTWNNHNDDIYVYEIQDMDEFIPSQAIGADRVCLGGETESYYTTNLVIDTMETQWLLIPEDAGTLTSLHDSLLITWNPNFSDTAWLQVRAVNEYGESAYSEPKEIIISPALNLSEIIGPDSVCTVHNEPTELYIQNEDQLMINWFIEPQEAGAITILNDTALINWNPQFEGQTILKYAALNKCDQEEFSSDKEIFVQSCVGVNKLQGYYFQVYPNPASTQVTFDYQLPIGKEKAQLIIRNTEGKQVAQFQLTNESGQKVWDTRSLNAGTYIYEYVCDDLKQTGKIVIVK